MARKSKLLAALDAHKGRDYQAERQKKSQKAAAKRKREKVLRAVDGGSDEEDTGVLRGEESLDKNNPAPDFLESDGWESDESDVPTGPNTTAFVDDESDESDSSIGDANGPDAMDIDLPAGKAVVNGNNNDEAGAEEDEEEEDDDDEDDGGIPLSDIESLASSERADLLPHQRLTINNTLALTKAHKSIALPYASLRFSAHQVVTARDPISIPDINDDLNRELAFYKQCLSAAETGRAQLKKEGVPFSRPDDYFAEMVKSEEQMGKIKRKMVDEAAGKKAAAEARRQRDLKKFGKQVQVAKMQERSKAKREALEKIDLLKKKRKNTSQHTTREDEDLFDIAVDRETKDSSSTIPPRRGEQTNNKRRKKDEKFGFGGKKRFTKSNDAVSTGDIRGFSARKMKEGGGGRAGGRGGKGQPVKTRPGKNRRAKART